MRSHQIDAAPGRRAGQGRFFRILAGFGAACVVLSPIGLTTQSSDTPTHTPADPSAIQPATPPIEKAAGIHPPPGSGQSATAVHVMKSSTPEAAKPEPTKPETPESTTPAQPSPNSEPASELPEAGAPESPDASATPTEGSPKSDTQSESTTSTEPPAPGTTRVTASDPTAIQPADPTVEQKPGIHPGGAPSRSKGGLTTVKGQVVSAPGASGSQVRIAVRDLNTEGQLIRGPVNKSVLVDLSIPAREVRLAKPEFAEVNFLGPTQLIVTGKSFGTTQLILTFGERDQRVFDIAVDLELERLIASIRTAVPRAKVKAHALMDSVVLTGDVPDTEAAERILQVAQIFSTKVLNHMRIAGTQQVMLRCTVAEIAKSITRQLGFNGWMGGQNLRDTFVVNNLNQINPANIGAAAGAPMTGVIPFVTGDDGIPITGNTTLSVGFPRAQLQVFVQALRENGLLRVMAEPNLVAINGQAASFLAGGEIPIPVSTSNTIDIKFKEFGVRLNFTPAVLSEDRIRLKVAPEVSEPDFTNSVTFGGISIPGFATRRVETTVELANGETIAIGGLLNERVRSIVRAVPGLGEIPVLGALFRSSEYQADESELVILVTPELVDGVAGDQITSVPGASYVQPNDFELYLLGQDEGQPKNPNPTLQPRVNHRWPVKGGAQSPAAKVRGPLGPAGGEEGK